MIPLYRYFVFCISEYYPSGGMNDCELKTNDLEQAKLKLKWLKEEGLGDERCIYDQNTDEIIE